MITSNLIGGLGNLMFQISTAYTLALRNNDNAYFNLNSSIKSVTKHYENINKYKDNIFHKINDINLQPKNNYNEPYFHYVDIPYQQNLIINGYFQSYRYFENQRKEILDLYEIKKEIKEYIFNKYGNILEEVTISLHVRRNDYLKFSNVYHVQDMTYYKKCLEYIHDYDKVLIFSDDMLWCKNNFKGNYVFIEGEQDYIDMYLMSLCNHNIIANSSFSWWGAYLNQRDGKVIAPNKWFVNNNKKTEDIYCPKWIKF